MALALWIFGLLASACLVSANIFEYQVDAQPLRPCELQRARAFQERADHVPQCAEDGSFQTVQCRSDGRSCWCVGADGREVAGSRQPGRPVACLSFCQLHRQQVLLSGYLNGTAASYLPQCQDSGAYAPVQCDMRREQCWCVDTEGMEVYGTRQRGRPTRCPRSCEIRNRRLLHGVGDKSPPQCSPDGGFLPVQCKFVNTTDMMVFDLVHGYNRFPDAFVTFSAFRRRFPEVSGYCHCADSQGRELAETGLELLLDDIYDTVFAGLALAPTFTDTTLYRILQRRFLALQLVLSGRFRCPTKCEVERFTATDFGHAYVPSCHRNGDFQAVQCQRGGPCWCADAQGKEVPGTRRQDAALPCAGTGSCSSERRRALSRLRFGPSGDLSLRASFVTSRRGAGGAPPCPPAIKELFVDSGILRSLIEGQNPPFPAAGSLLPEAIRGLFPSRELARLALQFTANPKRLQQNLFGGRFLANVGQFNLSGALGTRGSFNFSQFFQRLGLPGFQGGGGLVNQAKLLSAGLDSNPAVEMPGAAKEGRAMNKTIVGSFGFEVNVQENQNALKSLASLLDLPEFLLFLQHAVSVPEDIARDLGDVTGIVLNSQGCELTPGGLYVPSCTAEGSYEDVQCFAGECWCVDSQGKELPSSRVRGGRPRCPTECEKQRARRLSLAGSQPAGSSLPVPSCTRQGHFLPVQCFDSKCYCVDEEGQAIPGTQSAPGRPQQCPTPCQLRAERAFLKAVQTLVSNSSLPPALSSVYIPQCSARGRWSPVQCDGPPEQAFEWYERWRAQDNGGRELTAAELLTKVLSYRDAASGSFRRFLQSLYEAGQQGVFPGLARYSSLGEVPPAVLDGNRTRPGGSVLLEPYLFWQILRGQLRRYPGPYSDFSAPLAHLDLRTCWCVDEAGQEREGTRTEPGEVPACPGSCADAQLRALQFIADSEEVVSASNSSWFPLGESLLAASGIRLSNEELGLPPGSPPREAFSQQFLRGSKDALRLAAQSTFDFYQSRRSSPAASSGASRLWSSPYVPQCDAFGNWEPVQCHAGTGNCWCVDGKGQYVPASLTARSSQAPQCPSACERARASGLLSSWKQAGSQGDPSPDDLFIPTCLETGEFARLQGTEAGTWCVDQASGEGTPPRTNSSAQCPGLCEAPQGGILSGTAGPGYTPACGAEDGGRSSVQCSPAQESCWCVLGSGEEVPGTRVVGSQPACESPQCPLPFNTSDVAGGVVLCEPASGPGGAAVQRCQLLCRRGYLSAFPLGPLECSLERRRWLSQPPQPRACQRPQLWQTLQTRAQFQLRLPPGKMCSADYAGLLLAFQAFVSDELTARGFCQVQVQTVGTPVTVPACDDSAVRVECLTQERLGVNVTWKLRLEDVPPASLPDLRDIEEALAKGLAGRFVDLIRSGEFQLHLDAKTFPADTSLRFLHGDSVGTSPRTRYGCLEGFHPVSAPSDASQDPLGCVKCPEGSYSQDEQCVPCPAGFYQEQAGSLTCTPCPVGRTTISAGAFSRTHCVTDCQRNEAGLQCDQDGRYRASQRDRDSGKAFCVDDAGQRLLWSETEAPLIDSQCLMMQKFEKVPESKVVFDAEVAAGVRSQVPGSEFPLAQCLAGCAVDPACSFLTVSTVGSDVSCDFYAWTSDSIACTASGQGQGAAGNAKATGFGSLRCQVKVPPRDQGSVAVYLKKGQEFSTRSRKSFERTGFQNSLSGMYSPAVFEGPGASLTEAHLFCLRACDRDACCDGFILTQVQGGPIVCGLLSSPDILLCHVQDWRDPSTATANATCPGATAGQGSRLGTLLLGGQEFQGEPEPREGTQGPLTSFQQVYLWKDSDMGSRSESTGCRRDMGPMSAPPPEADMTSQLFSPVDLTQVVVSGNRSLPSRQHWLFKHLFSPQQANLWCLSRCAQEPSFCQLAEIRDSAPSYFTCTLYPEARVCEDVLEPRPTGCRLILPRRPSALFRRKDTPLLGFGTSAPSVTITPHGQLLGRSQAIQVGTSWKQVDQFLGVPYAAPPLAEGRFWAPEPSNWTGSWAATKPRARCWQPGVKTPTPSGVSEDCLYLNVFVPQNVAPNASVLLFFHNMEAGADDGSLALDGSFLAATGHLIVVTAGYRVGIFGFLSAGAGAVSGNWGLLDQVAALTWVQTHIAAFGGDPRRVTMAADHGGADVASIHLLTAGAGGSRLFRRAVLMGGSALSPAAVISPERAQQQAAALAQEVGCPASPIQEMTSCLRQKPADALNDAQTKLLAVSGPFHYWGPVLDGQFLREAPARALQRAPRATVDLLLGSSQDDGLIRRAKAVKQFEESQGRTSSKTAFYQALQNSLGGEDADPGVLAAATWYYSLEHSANDYASFSRALENATRDYFITCPVIDMARHWARRARGNVFLYHAPQSYGHGSLEVLADAQYAFGLPFHPAYGGQFTPEEKHTALKVMQYFSNFIRSGNPNYPHEFSRKGPEFAVPWPDFVPGTNGENYKEFSAQLPNRRGLKKADCSFWSKYIRSLKVPADEAKDGLSAGSEEEEQPAGSGLREDLPDPGSKSYSK
ncbi:thyroglobulin [Myotis lucifugus]|uniref:thyroglobulin n=1 Tax=Myotis lucifugus TaxID=59463 RepID=UPI0003C476E6|nr:thyroglobulin [Myotis lucifugus]